MIRRFLQQMMIGRYGGDELNRTLSIASLVCFVLSFFFWFFYPLAMALVVWSLVRSLSRNIPARLREREAYLKTAQKFRTKLRLYKRMWHERKTHRYFTCKSCKAVIRIPKGRGEVDVGCPKCGVRTKQKS